MWPRLDRLMLWFEGAGSVVALLVRIGLLSSAAFAAFLGQIVLSIVLVLVALGISLRLWRRRRNRALL